MTNPDAARKLLDQASAMRQSGATDAQRQRRKRVDQRNAEIQRVGPRPKDGITFGKKGKD